MDFFKTPMGRQFFERTMPQLVRQIAALNQNIEAVLTRVRAEPQEVWLAYHDAHEMHVMPCGTEEEAYEYLSTRALNLRDDIPEGWTTEETVQHWHELTGDDEYMRVEGPVQVR